MSKREYRSYSILSLRTDDGMGEVTALVNVFGVLDGYGTIFHLGAFRKSIDERFGKIKVLDNHRTGSTHDAIAKLVGLREVRRDDLPDEVRKNYPQATGALEVRTRFMMDDPASLAIFRRLKAGVVDEWSIGFEIIGSPDYQEIEYEGKKQVVSNIREVKLWEVSPVVFAANEATATTDVRVDAPETRVVEETDDTIRVRIFNPDQCTDGTFRTKTLSAKEGIKAVMCKKSGESTMSIQSVIFDKAKGWTKASAQKWVSDHDMRGQEADLETREFTPDGAQQRLGDIWKANVFDAHMGMCNMALKMGYINGEEHRAMCETGMKMMDMMDEDMSEDMRLRPVGKPGGMMSYYGRDNSFLTFGLTDEEKVKITRWMMEAYGQDGNRGNVESDVTTQPSSLAEPEGATAPPPTNESREQWLQEIDQLKRELLAEVEHGDSTSGHRLGAEAGK